MGLDRFQLICIFMTYLLPSFYFCSNQYAFAMLAPLAFFV